jgi:proline iminopeptidase
MREPIQIVEGMIMPAVELSDHRTAWYEVIGGGEPMLMFPGGPGFAASYLHPMAHLLADRFECYLIDPHGSGASSPPGDPSLYDHIGHARFYDETRRALGLGPVSLLGHSFGGTVALTYAALFPAVAGRCVSVDGLALGSQIEGPESESMEDEIKRGLERHSGASWYPEAVTVWEEWTDRVLAAQTGEEVDRMMATVAPLYFAHPDRPEVRPGLDSLRTAFKSDLDAVKAWESGLWQTIDLRPLLPRIECPVLVVAGKEDLICGPAQASQIAAGVPTAELVIVPECGHNPEIEAPEELRRSILEWSDKFDVAGA